MDLVPDKVPESSRSSHVHGSVEVNSASVGSQIIGSVTANIRRAAVLAVRPDCECAAIVAQRHVLTEEVVSVGVGGRAATDIAGLQDVARVQASVQRNGQRQRRRLRFTHQLDVQNLNDTPDPV
jgi:hypothetical protein